MKSNLCNIRATSLLILLYSQFMFSQSNWSLEEETTIAGMVNGMIQMGHIFKTTSGSIYEVAEPTVQVVVEVYPKVLVLRKGSSFKLIVEGFDEPLICTRLKTPVIKKKNTIVEESNVVESQIEGEFEGWDGETIFRLSNGGIYLFKREILERLSENCQRDLNISFVNELALIFDRMNIDTTEVLEAAGTKFNFLPFKPGLVGGHCISVDPYYLTSKAETLGYYSDVINSGRRVNDEMGKFIANKVVKLMMRKDLKVIDSKVLILGFTFKEDCPDVRNTRVIDIYNELRNFDIQVDVHDPWANGEEVNHEYGIEIFSDIPDKSQYSAVILAVAHEKFRTLDIRRIVGDNGVVYDVKAILPKNLVDARL